MAAGDDALLALRPLCRTIAHKLVRRLGLPASVQIDELVQAGMVGAWQAIQRFDGRGKLEGFASIRIQGAMLDWLRQEHPVGRGGPQVEFVSLDDDADGEHEALQLPAADDPAAELERDEAAKARLRALPPRERRVVQQVLAGRQVAEVGARLGVSESRASQLVASAVTRLETAGERTPAGFDPAAVPISMGVKIPKVVSTTQFAPGVRKPRRNRWREMVQLMPATGSVILAPTLANNLISELKRAGLRYARRTLADGRVMVVREPSKEQFE